MTQIQHNQLVSFIWNIANDVLVNVYNKGDYRKVILPMIVLRRICCRSCTQMATMLPMTANKRIFAYPIRLNKNSIRAYNLQCMPCYSVVGCQSGCVHAPAVANRAKINVRRVFFIQP